MTVLRLVVLDAACLTGAAILQGLYERGYPLDGIAMLTVAENADQLASIGDEDWPLLSVDDFDFRDSDLCLVTGNSEMAARWVPRMRDAGARVIDDTAYSRTLDVPLLLPESPEAAIKHAHIAVPCAVSVALALILAPLAKAFGLGPVQVTTLQAVSGIGQAGIDGLVGEVRAMFNHFEHTLGTFRERIAFNLIPQIGALNDEGWSQEEMKLALEVPVLLNMPDLSISATCVRVPVFYGHSGNVVIALQNTATLKAIEEVLALASGLSLTDKKLPTPEYAIGSDAVLLGRLRLSAPDNCLHLCFSIDNIRRGAAFNSVELAMLAVAA